MSESTALDSSRSSTLITLPAGTSYNGESCFDVLQEDEEVVPDWSLCVHPQGWVYFFNPLLKVVTDQDIRKPSVFGLTKENCLQYPLDELSDGMEVHLHLQSLIGNGNTSVFGLAVNHVHCVASYDLQEIKSNNACFLTPKRLNRCRRLYWNYLWNHPAHVPSPSRAIEDASEALTWFYTDNLISGAKSTVPFSKVECDELSRIVRELTVSSNDRSVSKTVFLSWLLREVCSFRDAEDWGQYTQKDLIALRQRRTNPPQTVHLPPPVVLFLLNFVINVLFFGIPHTYRAHVKATSEYRGRLANVQQNWAKYIERLVREYSHFLLISTVLLSATVGFLAVPNIPEGAQVAGTISALASLGSIIVGVFSIWRHQANTATADSFTYMHNVQRRYLGLYGHAILLSLPPTLLVWAILTFIISIVVYVMHGITEDGTWTRVSAWAVFTVFVIFVFIVFLALYTFAIVWKVRRRSAGIRYRISSLWTQESKARGQGTEA